MRFSLITLAYFTIIAGSHPVEPPTRVFTRDVTAVTSALNQVGQAIDNLDTAVNDFSGDAQPLEDAVSQLSQAVNISASIVDSSDLSQADSLSLQPLVQNLMSKYETFLKDLTNQKSITAKSLDEITPVLHTRTWQNVQNFLTVFFTTLARIPLMIVGDLQNNTDTSVIVGLRP